MGKRFSKEEQARLEGMKYALRFLEANGNSVEALRDEVAARGALGLPIPVSTKELDNYERAVKANQLDCIVVLALAILHDKYGFGEKRIKAFLDSFMLCADAMEHDRLAWGCTSSATSTGRSDGTACRRSRPQGKSGSVSWRATAWT